MKERVIMVASEGGFIGGNLVAELLRHGDAKICAVDIQPLDEMQPSFDGVKNIVADLQLNLACSGTAAGNRGRKHGR